MKPGIKFTDLVGRHGGAAKTSGAGPIRPLVHSLGRISWPDAAAHMENVDLGFVR